MLLLLLLQIAIILALSRVTASILTKLGEPRVVGEMIAGLLLGPSCLGWAFPRLSAAVFSPSSLAPLNALSQFGLVVFMFLVGLGLDVEHVRSARGIAIRMIKQATAATRMPNAIAAPVQKWRME